MAPSRLRFDQLQRVCPVRHLGSASLLGRADRPCLAMPGLLLAQAFGREGYLEQTINVEVLICEVNNAASRRWVQAGRSAPRLSGPSSAS
jgi:hypothetical protein